MKKYAIYDPTAMVYVRVRDDLAQPFDDTSDLEEAPLYNSVECIKDMIKGAINLATTLRTIAVCHNEERAKKNYEEAIARLERLQIVEVIFTLKVGEVSYMCSPASGILAKIISYAENPDMLEKNAVVSNPTTDQQTAVWIAIALICGVMILGTVIMLCRVM